VVMTSVAKESPAAAALPAEALNGAVRDAVTDAIVEVFGYGMGTSMVDGR